MIAIIDYNCGNLRSIAAACEKVGAECIVSADPADIARADALILPGVGSFGPAMKALRDCGLVEPIKRRAASGKLLLGICLGMQLLVNESEEGGGEGLGLIPGRCYKLPDDRTSVPHVGWESIAPTTLSSWAASPLEATSEQERFYFCHSFGVAANAEHWLAMAPFGDLRVAAAIRHGNIFGLQFHPEKSGEAGLDVFRQLRRMVEERRAA